MPSDLLSSPANAAFDVLVCGSLNLDLVSFVPRLPNPGETLPATALARLPGGKGLNQAVAAARQGAQVALIGATGLDAQGAELRDVLRQEGISHEGVQGFSQTPTGLAVIQVAADAENTIVIHSGANAALTAADVRACIEPARVYLAQLETPIATLHEFFDHARKWGALRVLNAAPAVSIAMTLFDAIDVLIVNEGELRTFACAEPFRAKIAEDVQDEVALARRLLNDQLQTVIVTLGARGARVIDLHNEILIPAEQVTAVDTTGAGDCFCGVFATALSQGMSLHAAVQRAVSAATVSTLSPGAIAAMPRL